MMTVRAKNLVRIGIAILLTFVFIGSAIYYYRVIEISIESEEGCVEEKLQESQVVRVKRSGDASTPESIPVGSAPVSIVAVDGAILDAPRAEDKLIETMKCFGDSTCEVWERAEGKVITLLVGGSKFEIIKARSITTGTLLDEERSYFNGAGRPGLVVAAKIPAPRCFDIRISDIKIRYK